MNNKQRYSSNDVFAKGKCITDFFSNNTGSSGNCITHRWILILTTGICGVMADTAALWADESIQEVET